MNLSRETLTHLEAETGFRASTLEKVLRLGAIAREVAEHPGLLWKAQNAKAHHERA
jgi:hypothetical protein